MGWLYVFIGGGLGSLCRYGINTIIQTHHLKLPVATITANVLAGLIAGLLTGYVLRHESNETIMLLGVVGFCGGFSTFSTFSLENVQLWQSGHFGAVLANVVLSVVLCFGSVWLGLRIAS